MKNPILRNGTAFALTVALGYAACAAVFWIFPGSAMTFMNALFHGLDFRMLQPASNAFDFSGFAYAGVILTAWAFMLGCAFGAIGRFLEGAAATPRVGELARASRIGGERLS